MINIFSYSLTASTVNVKLKCSCGERRIIERAQSGAAVLICSACGERTTVKEVKAQASTYWRNRKWRMDTVKERAKDPRVEVDIPVSILVKKSSDDPVRFTYNGRVAILSTKGMLCVVDDFKEEHFESLSADYQRAVVRAPEPPAGFPVEIITQIAGVKFQKSSLPGAQLTLSFKNTPEFLQSQVGQFVAALQAGQSD